LSPGFRILVCHGGVELRVSLPELRVFILKFDVLPLVSGEFRPSVVP
jgi:hypothetical protein